MKINLVAVGDKMPVWIKQGYEEYAKRFPRECELHLIQIPASKSKDFIKKIPANTHRVILDEHGELWDTSQVAAALKYWQSLGKNISLVIGGAEGLDKKMIAEADQCWSLSRLTFPHMLVRVLAAEQLYRGLSILAGHPYHRV